MAQQPAVQEQAVNNNTSAAAFWDILSEGPMLNQTGDGALSSIGMVYVLPRPWGYMSLENVRPVFTNEVVSLNPYTIPLYGCVMPIFAVLILFTNCLTIAVLTQKGMRSATGCLLISIALADISMAVFPIPSFFYFFSLGQHHEWVPYKWCYASLWMLEYLPTIFHATSIWLMVALTGQRYLAVCQPLQTQRWCVSNATGAVQCAIIIFILSGVSQVSRIFESKFSPLSLPSRVIPGVSVVGCTSQYAPFVSAFTKVYFMAYFCFKTLAVHLIPCTSIVYLALRIAFHKAKRRCCHNQMMLSVSYRSRIKEYWVRLAELKYSTSLVMALVLLFLTVEIPLSIFYCIELVQDKMVFEFNIIHTDNLTTMIMFANMSTVVISPFKFLILLSLCKRFRSNLKEIFLAIRASCSICDDDEDDDLE